MSFHGKTLNLYSSVVSPKKEFHSLPKLKVILTRLTYVLKSYMDQEIFENCVVRCGRKFWLNRKFSAKNIINISLFWRLHRSLIISDGWSAHQHFQKRYTTRREKAWSAKASAKDGERDVQNIPLEVISSVERNKREKYEETKEREENIWASKCFRVIRRN